jgi:hypothetical protein
MRVPAFLVASLLFFFPAFQVRAQDVGRLFVRPWVELEPMVRIEPDTYPLPIDAARQKVLEEGRTLFSAMIYGWKFTYVPGDIARKVQESFALSLVAEVPWGNPRMVVIETEVANQKLWARMSFTLSDEQAARRSAWASNTVTLSTGQGAASVMKGPAAKATALQDAVRDAIRRGLDARVLNKPREISGEVVLWEDPQTFVRAGVYATTAKVKFMVGELVPYRIF